MLDRGMRKCSAGACPPLGRGRGVAESAVPIRRTKPQLRSPQFVIPAKAGIHAMTFRERTSTAMPPPTSTLRRRHPVHPRRTPLQAQFARCPNRGRSEPTQAPQFVIAMKIDTRLVTTAKAGVQGRGGVRPPEYGRNQHFTPFSFSYTAFARTWYYPRYRESKGGVSSASYRTLVCRHQQALAIAMNERPDRQRSLPAIRTCECHALHPPVLVSAAVKGLW